MWVEPYAFVVVEAHYDHVGGKGELQLFSTDSLPYIRTAQDDVAAWGLGISPIAFKDISTGTFGARTLKEGQIPGTNDHQSFHIEGVPVYFVNTGLHTDLHRPGDEAHKINYGKMTDISKMAFLTVYRLANPGVEIAHN
jgi:hypothetical protein